MLVDRLHLVKSCTLLFLYAPSQDTQHNVLCVLGAKVKPNLILSLLPYASALSSFIGWDRSTVGLTYLKNYFLKLFSLYFMHLKAK